MIVFCNHTTENIKHVNTVPAYKEQTHLLEKEEQYTKMTARTQTIWFGLI
jgi:hypothetical protein